MAKRQALVLGTSGQIEQLPAGDFLNIGHLNLGNPTTVPIASNSIAIGTSSFYKVSSPSYSQLDNISGGVEGQVIVLMKSSPSDQFQVTNAGNVKVPYWLYASNYFCCALIKTGSNWIMIGFSANN